MSSSSDTLPLPSYARPPVVETVLGVQFDRLPGFTNAHLGAFWKTLDPAEWPTVTDAPALPPQLETFNQAAKLGRSIRFQLTQEPLCRLQFKNAAGDRMLQIQNGRLHFNWLASDYPRYEVVREGFVTALRQFTEFVALEGLAHIRPNQWEITYINQIPQGTVWTTPNDWRFFRPLNSAEAVNDTVQCESFTGEWHFVIPPERGRLHIEWQHGIQASPEQNEREIIGLTLTARGPLDTATPGTDGILGGLDLGRATIVRTFASLMSDSANQYWGLTNANTHST